MNIEFIYDHPSCADLIDYEDIYQFTENALNFLRKENYHLSILLTSDLEIRKLNRRYRDRDKATNVLSFPLSDDTVLQKLEIFELGDIAISLDTAVREAQSTNTPIQKRIRWLIVHGLLHLLGYDHERSSIDERKMFQLEKLILTRVSTRRSMTMPKLAINVDHVATVRQARGISEPDPVTAASICEQAGASGIVIHLREDRRHIQDRDVYLMRKMVKTKLNLEMGANKEIISIALDVLPDLVTLVPEKRQELTTEGGLDVLSQQKKLAKVIKRFDKAGIPVSIFVDPDSAQIKASSEIGAKFVEIHTGRYCDAVSDEEIDREFDLIERAAEEACATGLIVNGGHGLNYQNTGRIAALGTMDELSIGHAVISRAVFTGLERAVQDMLAIIRNSQLQLF